MQYSGIYYIHSVEHTSPVSFLKGLLKQGRIVDPPNIREHMQAITLSGLFQLEQNELTCACLLCQFFRDKELGFRDTTMNMLAINMKFICSSWRNGLGKVHFVTNKWPCLPLFKFHHHRLISPEADAEKEIGVDDVYQESKPVKERRKGQDWTKGEIEMWFRLGNGLAYSWGSSGTNRKYCPS